jgi:ABC-2 type transport system permease protein
VAIFVSGLASVGTLLVVSSVVLGAQWGHPLAVLALVVGSVLAAMGISAVIMTLATTEEQASGYSSMVAVLLALLGGNFLPIAQAPAVLRRLTLLTPNGWALRGFADLGTGAKGAAVLPSLAALGAFAIITGGAALARAGRVVER